MASSRRQEPLPLVIERLQRALALDPAPIPTSWRGCVRSGWSGRWHVVGIRDAHGFRDVALEGVVVRGGITREQ